MTVFAGQLLISGFLLFYTAIIAPAQVFLWEFNDDECNSFPTLYFDVFVDSFFMVRSISVKIFILLQYRCPLLISSCLQTEIVLQFFTGSVDLSEKYCDDIRVISTTYLTSFSGFCFDCMTSIPWSFNDLYSYQVTVYTVV